MLMFIVSSEKPVNACATAAPTTPTAPRIAHQPSHRCSPKRRVTPKTAAVSPKTRLNRLAIPTSICRTANADSKASAWSAGAAATHRSTIFFSAIPSTACNAVAIATVMMAPVLPTMPHASARRSSRLWLSATSAIAMSATPRNWPRCLTIHVSEAAASANAATGSLGSASRGCRRVEPKSTGAPTSAATAPIRVSGALNTCHL